MSTEHRRRTSIEREWERQERALDEERRGLPSAGEDARLLRYRQLARALRQPLEEALPADFASLVVQRVEAEAAAAEARDRRFERSLIGVLVALFGLAIGAMIAIIGVGWLQTLAPVARLLANPWLFALLACVGVSRLFEGWRGHLR
jgi:uncharacterized membrane protein YcjF (UPF0283 family)